MADFCGFPEARDPIEMVQDMAAFWSREFGDFPKRLVLPNQLYNYVWKIAATDPRFPRDIKRSLEIFTPYGKVTLVPEDESQYIEQTYG